MGNRLGNISKRKRTNANCFGRLLKCTTENIVANEIIANVSIALNDGNITIDENLKDGSLQVVGSPEIGFTSIDVSGSIVAYGSACGLIRIHSIG